MFSLAISCLTRSYLPWFTYLTFHVPTQYCSLQHQTLLSPPGITMAEHHFCFGPVTSFFLELLVIALHASPGAYWTSSDLGGSSSGVTSFGLFILFMGFQVKNIEWYAIFSFILQTTFSQNSSLWSICLAGSCMAWLIALLSYASPLVMTRLWSIKGWLSGCTQKSDVHILRCPVKLGW